ncbi:MAG: septum formation initiator family protein [bacterium]
MKNKTLVISISVVFLIIIFFLIYDTFVSYSEVSKNKEIIAELERDSKILEKEMQRIRLQVENLEKDPKAAEEILREKLKLLKSNQFYINDKTD